MDAFGVDGIACLVTVVAASFLTIFLTPTVRHFAVWLRAVDLPGPRRAHTRPTARLGGLGVFAGILGGSLLGVGALGVDGGIVWSVLGIGAGVCLLGAFDDRYTISPMTKLAGLALAGVLLAQIGLRVDVICVPGFGMIELGWVAVPATVVWVVACSNAVNLIDGVDGAATGVVTIAACTMALFAFGTGDPTTAVLFSATCGAAGGFLVHNRQPASIFLGDSGSLLLGFMLAATSAAGCSKGPTAWILLSTLLVLAVPFLEATQSFVRRFRAASTGVKLDSILRAIRATAVADMGHIHHRLLVRGLSHHRVSFILHVVTAILGVNILLLVPHGNLHWSATLVPIAGGIFALYQLATLEPYHKATKRRSSPRMVEIPLPGIAARDAEATIPPASDAHAPTPVQETLLPEKVTQR